MPYLTRGYIQVYTGNGKGKTTAALGLALRAVTHGLSVAFIQFMKSGSEQLAAESIGVHTYRSFGKNHETDGWYSPLKPGEPVPLEILTGWDYAREVIASGTHDLVILDELNVAVYFGFIEVDQVLKTLHTKPVSVEVVSTGRGAPQELIDLADLVTNLTEIKHMYQKGVPARKGIDF